MNPSQLTPGRAEAYRRAILNRAYTQGVNARTLVPVFRNCGHPLNPTQLQALIDDLEADGLLHSTRSMKKTMYHTNAVRTGRSDVDETLLEQIVTLMRRLSKAETAQRVAHLLNITVDTATSYLEYACQQQRLRGTNVGPLRLFQP